VRMVVDKMALVEGFLRIMSVIVPLQSYVHLLVYKERYIVYRLIFSAINSKSPTLYPAVFILFLTRVQTTVHNHPHTPACFKHISEVRHALTVTNGALWTPEET